MTSAPHLLLGARHGYRLGDAVLHDALMYDGLEDAHTHEAMGRGHRALPAAVPGRDPGAAGRLRGGLARTGRPGHQGRPPGRRDHPGGGAPAQGRPAPRRDRRGHPAGHHDRSRWAGLRPAFSRDGSITAGNASQISDGGVGGGGHVGGGR